MNEEEVKIYLLLRGFDYYEDKDIGANTALWKMGKGTNGEHMLYFHNRQNKFSYTTGFSAGYTRYNNDTIKECLEQL